MDAWCAEVHDQAQGFSIFADVLSSRKEPTFDSPHLGTDEAEMMRLLYTNMKPRMMAFLMEKLDKDIRLRVQAQPSYAQVMQNNDRLELLAIIEVCLGARETDNPPDVQPLRAQVNLSSVGATEDSPATIMAIHSPASLDIPDDELSLLDLPLDDGGLYISESSVHPESSKCPNEGASSKDGYGSTTEESAAEGSPESDRVSTSALPPICTPTVHRTIRRNWSHVNALEGIKQLGRLCDIEENRSAWEPEGREAMQKFVIYLRGGSDFSQWSAEDVALWNSMRFVWSDGLLNRSDGATLMRGKKQTQRASAIPWVEVADTELPEPPQVLVDFRTLSTQFPWDKYNNDKPEKGRLRRGLGGFAKHMDKELLYYMLKLPIKQYATGQKRKDLQDRDGTSDSNSDDGWGPWPPKQQGHNGTAGNQTFGNNTQSGLQAAPLGGLHDFLEEHLFGLVGLDDFCDYTLAFTAALAAESGGKLTAAQATIDILSGLNSYALKNHTSQHLSRTDVAMKFERIFLSMPEGRFAGNDKPMQPSAAVSVYDIGKVSQTAVSAATIHTKSDLESMIKDNIAEIMSKLKHMHTEELRKWAKAYGIDSNKYRGFLLRELNPFADGIKNKWRPANPPLAPPTFTLATLRDAIPAHCFRRNLYTSLIYLAIDLIKIAILGYLATFISHPLVHNLPQWSPYVLWPIYWFCQGTTMTGVWVLAHECGHQAFSESELANNIVGTICHSLLLVPYHPWRITHGRHHNNTGSCENDEVFAPATRSDWAKEMLRETPLAHLVGIAMMLTMGWPGYLLFNSTGPAKYRGKNANHFSPTAVFFMPYEYWLVVQSNIAFFACMALLAYACYTFGALRVFYFYGIPYLITNNNLVLITYLQHTDVFMPHFRAKEWNWLRGALCTVDRNFGFFMNRALHHFTDTHVCHHVFSKIPFYNAEEATVHIKRVLGAYYLKDDTPVTLALYRAYSCCQFVEDEGDVVFYKNIK